MLILSQNKKTIVNTNLVAGYVCAGSEIRAFSGGDEFGSGSKYFILGAYPTTLRAEEILIDICNQLTNPITIMLNIFKMPEN